MSKSSIKVLIEGIVVLVIALLIMWFSLVPFTWQSFRFRGWLFFITLILFLIASIQFTETTYQKKRGKQVVIHEKKLLTLLGGVTLTILVVVISFSIASAQMFNASDYRNLIYVREDLSFDDNIENTDHMVIPIVDRNLAIKLGDKKLGESKGLGSQFDAGRYSIIEQQGELYWIAPLEYTGFFKWMNKRSEGVPGYVKVSATNPSKVEYIEKPMKIVPSAYFGQDLYRTVYKEYKNILLDSNYFFELDDENNPYFVISILNRTINGTRGLDVSGVVLVNAMSGEVSRYELDQVPDWVDRSIPQDIIMNQLNDWGRLVKGWKNTWTSKSEMMQVSEDYNIIYNNGDFYLMTGLTSVGNDESIVGITLTNMRTKGTDFYQIGGATEWAGQQSAQGVVQDLGYQASFPILVNYEGIPTYFMTLKDSEGLIKMYAFVNIKDYSIVGVGKTIIEAKNNYTISLRNSSNSEDLIGELVTTTSKVFAIQEVIKDGTSYYHLILEEIPSKVFIAQYSVNLELPFTKVGDTVVLKYYQTNRSDISIEGFDNTDLNIN